MNKQILINVAVFAAGAAVGFLVAQKTLRSKYEQIAQEEIDSVKEIMGRRVNTKIGAEDKLSDAVEKANTALQRMGTALTRSSLDGTLTNKYDQAKKNYNLVPSETAEEDEDEEEDDGILRDAAGMTEEDMNPDPDAVYHERDLSEVDRTEPYLIDDREYCEEFDHHDKLSLYYYRLDDVLCDEREEIIDDIDGTVGWAALQKLDMQTSCWVRNEPISTDFEIIAVNKSYAETVHGIGLEENLSPREKYNRQQRRREEE